MVRGSCFTETVKILMISLILLITGCGGGSDNPDDELKTWYCDADGDGYGDTDHALVQVNQPERYVANSQDIDDANPSVSTIQVDTLLVIDAVQDHSFHGDGDKEYYIFTP